MCTFYSHSGFVSGFRSRGGQTHSSKFLKGGGVKAPSGPLEIKPAIYSIYPVHIITLPKIRDYLVKGDEYKKYGSLFICASYNTHTVARILTLMWFGYVVLG